MGAINNFINSFITYLKDIHAKDKEKKNTLQDDIRKWKDVYKSSFSSFINLEKQKSNLFIAMYTCSPKFMTCILIFLNQTVLY